MAWWQALVLGLIQGLTEFLPISSSGHLVLGQYVLGLTADGTLFEIFVHFGTVMSIVTVYHERIGRLIRSALQSVMQPGSIQQRFKDDADLRIVWYIVITMLPTALAYVLFGDFLEATFGDPKFVCAMLVVTGILLVLTVLRKNPGGQLTAPKSVLIGFAQALALFPGISRSGSTICTALYLNVEPEEAANFSFLMLLPVVIGATLLKTLDTLSSPVTVEWAPIAIGTLASYVSGVIAIKALLAVVRKGKLQYFAIYCFLVGIVGFLLIG